MSVLFVDVDHFKQINDEFGHAVGDRALEKVASICGDSLRDKDFIGRYGGEEFLAVLPGADADAAGRVAERLRTAVEDGELSVDDCEIALTVSVGISECGPQFADFDCMLRAADRALYRAKREGRNRIVHHRFMLKGDRASRPGS